MLIARGPIDLREHVDVRLVDVARWHARIEVVDALRDLLRHRDFVTAAAIRRSASLTASSGTDSINASNWPISAQVDTTKYYSLSISAPSGCMLDANSISIDLSSSGTGPHSAAVATSADAFAHTSSVSATAPTTSTISASTSGNLEIRIYGFGATGSIGTMRIQNTLSVSGTLH